MPTTLPTLPIAPSRNRPSTFSTEADAFLGALPTWGSTINTVTDEVNTASIAAVAAATSAAATTGVTIWVSGTTYAVGDNRFDPTDFLTYRRKVAGAGTTRPGLDGTNWQVLSGAGDVTLNSAQTITGAKTFSAIITMNGQANIMGAVSGIAANVNQGLRVYRQNSVNDGGQIIFTRPIDNGDSLGFRLFGNSTSNTYLSFYNYTAGSTLLNMHYTGEVGVGTGLSYTPQYKLEVNGTVGSIRNAAYNADSVAQLALGLQQSASVDNGAIYRWTWMTGGNATGHYLYLMSKDTVNGDVVRFVMDKANGYATFGANSITTPLAVYHATAARMRVYGGSPGYELNDNGTGMFLGGTNLMDLYTSGVRRVRIDNNGDFLIGTTSSAGLLTLESAGVGQILSLNSAGSNSRSDAIINRSGTLTQGAGGSPWFGFRSTDAIYGTSNEVAIAGYANEFAIWNKTSGAWLRTVIVNGSGVMSVNNTTSGGQLLVAGATGSGVQFNDSNTKISLVAANTLAFNTSGTEQARLSSTGDIFMGQTTSVHVAAGRKVLSMNGTNESLISFNTGGSNRGYLFFTSTTATLMTTGGNLVLGTNGAGRVTVDTSGLVGINGTAERRLHVFGAAVTQANPIAFAASLTIDASVSNLHVIGNLTAAVTAMTINNAKEGQFISIRFRQDATGGRTVALPAGAAVAGTVSTAANKTSYLNLTYNGTDSRWEGSWTNIP